MADEKTAQYLQDLLKLPHVGSRGVNAIYDEVKKQGMAYNSKTKTGLTLKNIKDWYNSRAQVQTHKRNTGGYHSFTAEKPLQQFQIDLIHMTKAWRNNRNQYSLVCVDVFTKKADMEPMKDKEATTCNNAMETIFKRMGIPESIYCDEGSEFTNKKFLDLLASHKIEIIYATNHAPFVESFNRTMKRMMNNYMESNGIQTWTNIYRDLINSYNSTKHSTTKFAPNDIKKEDIQAVRKNIRERGRTKNYDQIEAGDTVRLALKEKKFRKESDPTYSHDLNTVVTNEHNGLYIVDGKLHTRKDLQLVKGAVIQSPQPTPQQKQKQKVKDQVGKAAVSPVLKDLMDVRPSVDQVENIIAQLKPSRNKATNYAVLANQVYNPRKK